MVRESLQLMVAKLWLFGQFDFILLDHKDKQGGEGRGEQRGSLRTKALMQDLGTRLEYQHRDSVFVRTGKTLWK